MNLWIIFQISNYKVNGSTLSVWVSCLLAVNLPDILKKACFKAANIIFTVTELKLNHVIMITWGNKVTSILILMMFFKEIQLWNWRKQFYCGTKRRSFRANTCTSTNNLSSCKLKANRENSGWHTCCLWHQVQISCWATNLQVRQFSIYKDHLCPKPKDIRPKIYNYKSNIRF